jgi:hypothetical protein
MDYDAPAPQGVEPVDANAQRILARLLTASFPGDEEIARQGAMARSRVIDEDGSLELLVGGSAPPALVDRRIPVEAEAEDIDGMTFHVLLHVVDGYINELEVYREDLLPMQSPIQPDALRVIVL